MRAVPLAARVYILGAVLLSALCATPALSPAADVPWPTVGLLAALAVLWGSALPRLPLGRAAAGPDWCGPVLLAGAFLLPAPAAALVAVPAALLGPVERRPVGVRRLWRCARSALAAYAASYAFGLGGGRDALAASHVPAVSGCPGFPHALAPAVGAALVLGLTSAALEGGVLVTAEGRSPRLAWRGRTLCSLVPHLAHGLAGLTMAVLWRSPYGPAAALLALPPMYVCARVFALCHQERAAHQATVRALVQAVDIKDRYTRGHSERVGRASVMIARELGMDGDRIETLRVAGVLHDVGKLGVPTRLLRKNGPLTPEERGVIELHPEYGHEMVRGIGFLGEARDAILHHHERLDGSGYPHGLAGADIPEAARVVAVADAFDAMTSTRAYRRARPVPAAVEELKRCAGAQFDPRMVDALTRALDRHGWHTPAPPEPRPLTPAGRRRTADPLRGEARERTPGRTPGRSRGRAPDRAPDHASDQRGNVPPAPPPTPPPTSPPETVSVPDAAPRTPSSPWRPGPGGRA
ncbi:HD-GYP domain-containing protein [Streptomyces sparsogenes]|uniref:HD-GYP domain-containing protein n=1 Tax=Streptomyces sparsogenes TaxID=67365 RepID=UPI00340754AF